jgi:GT2 family glycosyltransferase
MAATASCAPENHGDAGLTFTPEALRRQNELLQTLRKELASQKWVFEQFLKSPSWRLTYPLRWIAGHFRRRPAETSLSNAEIEERVPLPSDEHSVDLKAAFTSLCSLSLENIFASDGMIELRRAAKPAVSIVLVLFNRAELTLACLRSIAETVNEEFEVILVDNASSDDTPRLLEHIHGAHIIRNSENRNFLLGVNQAVRACRGDYILLLNNDAVLLPGAVRNALRTIRGSSDIGAVGGKIVLLDGTLQEAGSVIWRDGSCLGYGRGDNPFSPPYMFRRDVDYCSAAFLLTSRSAWDQLGGLDETFRPAYYEETDYCLRLWQRGLRVVYEPTSAVIHYEFASSGSVSSATELQADHQRIFEERHRPVLKRHESPTPDRLIHARSRHDGRKILFIDDRVPHLWLGSGFPRAHTLLQALLKYSCFVTLYPLSETDEPWEVVYSDIPREVEVTVGTQPNMLPLFLKSREGYYDTIVVSRPHNMELLAPVLAENRKSFENVSVIYDAEALFAFREAGLRKLEGIPMSREEFSKTLADEIALAGRADLVISVSELERRTFLEHGIHRVEILGHSVEPAPTCTTFAEREGLLFVGAVHEESSPNGDSLVWFLTEVLPRVLSRLGNVRLTIAGVNESERVRALAGRSVELAGHVPDLTDLYGRSRLLIAPTRYAAGIPHKVHESAARGLPVVATSLLARQLGWTENELAIADDAEGFANRCIESYQDETRWTGLRNAALERVRAECSPKAFHEKVGQILRSVKPAVRLT